MNCRFEIVLKYVEIKQRNHGFGWSVDLNPSKQISDRFGWTVDLKLYWDEYKLSKKNHGFGWSVDFKY